MKKNLIALLAGLTLLAAIPGAKAEEKPLLAAESTLNSTVLKRGLAVFTAVCMGCHSLKYLHYRDLLEAPFNLTRKQVDTIRAGFLANSLNDGLTTMMDGGDAVAAYGVVPPDLSLIIRARESGADHTFSLLMGYRPRPADFRGNQYNIYFPNNNIAMPQPLIGEDVDFSAVSYLDGVQPEATLEEEAWAVTSFLRYVSEPAQIHRVQIGFWMLPLIAFFTWVAWLWKKAVWSEVKSRASDSTAEE